MGSNRNPCDHVWGEGVAWYKDGWRDWERMLEKWRLRVKGKFQEVSAVHWKNKGEGSDDERTNTDVLLFIREKLLSFGLFSEGCIGIAVLLINFY